MLDIRLENAAKILVVCHQ